MPGFSRRVFGGGPDLPRSSSVSAPGFDIKTNGTNTTLTRTPTLGLDAINTRFPRILSDIDARRGDLRPGFGALTRTRVDTVRDRSRAAIGSLRENLARRRVAGSSFGFDALNNAERQFAKEEADVRARSFLEELNAFNNSLTQEFGFIETELARELSEAGLAANVGAQAQSLINSNLQFLRNQIAQENAQFDSFLGEQFSKAQDSLSGASFFGGGGAGSGAAGAAGTNLFSGAGGASSAGFAFSDRRVKKDIRRVGTLDNGLPVYAFKYISGGPMQIGVMAQDVEKVNPEAVVDIAGVLHVDYGLATQG